MFQGGLKDFNDKEQHKNAYSCPKKLQQNDEEEENDCGPLEDDYE